MSKLTDKIFLMRNMNDEELKNYIRTLTDNEKDLIVYSAVKMIICDEFDRAFQNFKQDGRVVRILKEQEINPALYFIIFAKKLRIRFHISLDKLKNNANNVIISFNDWEY